MVTIEEIYQCNSNLSEYVFKSINLIELHFKWSLMAEASTRLRRLISDELGDCRDEDVEQRLQELHSLAESAFGADPARPVFAALGNETRYRLARTLAAADDELCVCELEPLVDVSESAVSHALSDLVDADLVTRRKEGNWRYYQTTSLAESLFSVTDQQVAGGE